MHKYAVRPEDEECTDRNDVEMGATNSLPCLEEAMKNVVPNTVPAVRSVLSRSKSPKSSKTAVEQARAGTNTSLADARLLPYFRRSDSFRRTRSLRAKPQRCGGEDVWPERWGMSKVQIKELLAKLRSDPTWDSQNSVYKMVADFIVPWTQGKGVGYALLVNPEGPKEVNVMVSHAWAESAEEFLETLLRSITSTDVVFVCALSLYQAEDDVGPNISQQIGSSATDSPFCKVLANIHSKRQSGGFIWRHGRRLRGLPVFFAMCAVLIFYYPIVVYGCLPTLEGCYEVGPRYHASKMFTFLRDVGILASVDEWVPCSKSVPSLTHCPWLAAVAGVLGAISWFLINKVLHIYRGRMLVIPNHEMDIYSRLWCIYEIYSASCLKVPVELGRTLASAGKVSSRQAECSCAEDAAQIHREIEASEIGYDQIDSAVCWVICGAGWEALRISFVHGTWLAAVNLAAVQLPCRDDRDEQYGLVTLYIPGFVLACLLAVSMVYYVIVRRSRGRPTRCQIWLLALALFLFCGFFRLLGRLRHSQAEYIGRAPFVLAAYLLCGSYLGPCLSRCNLLKKCAFRSIYLIANVIIIATILVIDVVASSHSADGLVQPVTMPQFYLSMVKSTTSVISLFGGPAYLCWSVATEWGVQLRS
eukprot:gb/GFBE01076117.1/.p1 GENE.gb/GFBE01076117.1/~~gb/GFBE01076117.1/.p1  ORF type:complete len:644 (+),score=86.64 gb/GFBE01076117.1/:1-1932(+)